MTKKNERNVVVGANIRRYHVLKKKIHFLSIILKNVALIDYSLFWQQF